MEKDFNINQLEESAASFGMAIPKNINNSEEMLDWLKSYADDLTSSIYKADRTSTESKIKFGQCLFISRLVVKGSGATWADFRKTNYGGYSTRTLERYVRMAEVADIIKAPTLVYLTGDQLLALAAYKDTAFGGEHRSKSIQDFLMSQYIDVEFEETPVEITYFKKQVTELIQKLKREIAEQSSLRTETDPETKVVETISAQAPESDKGEEGGKEENSEEIVAQAGAPVCWEDWIIAWATDGLTQFKQDPTRLLTERERRLIRSLAGFLDACHRGERLVIKEKQIEDDAA